jgi:hypothetical protein
MMKRGGMNVKAGFASTQQLGHGQVQQTLFPKKILNETLPQGCR